MQFSRAKDFAIKWRTLSRTVPQCRLYFISKIILSFFLKLSHSMSSSGMTHSFSFVTLLFFAGTSDTALAQALEGVRSCLLHDPTKQCVFSQNAVEKLSKISYENELNATLFPFLGKLIPQWRVLINSEIYPWNWPEPLADLFKPDFL